MSMVASQITSLTIVYSSTYSDAYQRKHWKSSVSLVFVRGIHRWPVNSPHKGPVTWKMFPFHDFIMKETMKDPSDDEVIMKDIGKLIHYNDVIMSAMASHIIGVLMVCSRVCFRCKSPCGTKTQQTTKKVNGMPVSWDVWYMWAHDDVELWCFLWSPSE